jgi:type IV secretion system protein TrbL
MTVMIGATVTAYAGQIVLALGALDYTRDIAAGYLRMALAMGLRAMTLAAIMGLGLNLENDILAMAGNAPSIGEIGLLTMGLIILMFMALIIPHHVAHLAGGGGGFFGGALGFGSAWMATQIAGRVVEQMGHSGYSGGGSNSAAAAVREALASGRDGAMSVEEAARHGERLRAEGVGTTRNGHKP